ncbi:yjeF-like protein [Idiomarina sp. A28L]|uniref:bifunctional ADP-dependent NAD(P)H-hydrate dehydratase/NAD(P)H-hydrate epimerase n=1 Tax=Idiomarina sp. A28L TaxID=1036674 RepID=UPI0002138A5A|nr:bifunctional ADP-dependent NAD(P)H-hydrate dehydratase/NAD(P)H-hydrate epimerase [Idiomarina sp. A28L]EGN74554.1 yjeF-like protein [Idiomarina sp. A28L]
MQTSLTRSIPQQLYLPEQVAEFEGEAAARAGLNLWQLMERAGAAAWECLQQQAEPNTEIAVLCGPGNNGGDGYILAQLAHAQGYTVRVFATGEPKSEEGQRAIQGWLEAGGEIEPLADWLEQDPDYIVDALLGTGLNSEVTGDIRECIEAVNDSALPVLSIDIPSGLNANTGVVMGVAVVASHTVTMVAVKRGLTTAMAADYVGQLWFADLGVQREFRLLTEPAAWWLQKAQLEHDLAPRKKVCQKGNFGHVLVIGGSSGMAGAARLAATAALRAGAGKVTVICEPGQEFLIGMQPELMVRGLHADAAETDELVERASVIAIGPGLGQSHWGRQWWQRFCQRSQEKPMPAVIDADALNLLAINLRDGEELPLSEGNVFTPHPGEAARLLQCQIVDIEQNRWLASDTLQELLTGTVVLKGAGSLISGASETAVCTHGTPAMAIAGMGDVLTGIIAGLLAQAPALGLNTDSATKAAVLVHNLAAEAAAHGNSRGMLATDVIAEIPHFVNPRNDVV